MTADEAQAVIALWQRERVERTGLTDRPAVPDVAEGLDVPVAEVRRLLAAVRARRLEEERALAQEQELAEQEEKLAEVRRRRAELRSERAQRQNRTASRPQWIGAEPGVREDAAAASPAWAYAEHKELESRRVGRALIKVCVWLMLLCGLLAVISLCVPHPYQSGLAPCYVNGEPASADACGGFDQGGKP
jgi:DNA-binding transcriptional MerR regulator